MPIFKNPAQYNGKHVCTDCEYAEQDGERFVPGHGRKLLVGTIFICGHPKDHVRDKMNNTTLKLQIPPGCQWWEPKSSET